MHPRQKRSSGVWAENLFAATAMIDITEVATITSSDYIAFTF